jgi:hypothetical protein
VPSRFYRPTATATAELTYERFDTGHFFQQEKQEWTFDKPGCPLSQVVLRKMYSARSYFLGRTITEGLPFSSV